MQGHGQRSGQQVGCEPEKHSGSAGDNERAGTGGQESQPLAQSEEGQRQQERTHAFDRKEDAVAAVRQLQFVRDQGDRTSVDDRRNEADDADREDHRQQPSAGSDIGNPGDSGPQRRVGASVGAWHRHARVDPEHEKAGKDEARGIHCEDEGQPASAQQPACRRRSGDLGEPGRKADAAVRPAKSALGHEAW